MRSEKVRREVGDVYKEIDQRVILEYHMDNQEFQNLHKLDSYKIMLERTDTDLAPAKLQNSYTQAYDPRTGSLAGKQGKELYKETFGKINLNRKVKIKRYAPEAFNRICKLSNVKEEYLLESLDPSKNIKQIQNAGLGAGASGSFFFFTNDHRFIMKTMSLGEVKQMVRILPAYLEHLETNDSFIARILGIYTIYMDRFTPISVMIMENGLPNIMHTNLHYTFDLKGSQVNREVL